MDQSEVKMTTSSARMYIHQSDLPYDEDLPPNYSAFSRTNFDVTSNAKPLVLKAIQESAPPVNGPFVICDYGTADGATSMSLIGDCIGSIRETFGKDKEIMVYYEDTPYNDFRIVNKKIQGLIAGPPSYMLNKTGIYVSCIGRSFYTKCLPANTVHLGLSFTAMHWLSTRPCTLKKTFLYKLTDDEEEKEAFVKQAAQDWATILLARSYELAKGGYMVIGCLCVNEKGQYANVTKHGNIYKRLQFHWAEMVTKGCITPEEFELTTMSAYFRSVEEFSAPFEDKLSEVYKSGLRLLSIETQVLPCYCHTKWITEGKKGDAKAARTHARWFVSFIRAWANSTFRCALNDTRTDEEKDFIVNEFFKLYEDEVASAPEDHATNLVFAYLLLKKVD